MPTLVTDERPPELEGNRKPHRWQIFLPPPSSMQHLLEHIPWLDVKLGFSMSLLCFLVGTRRDVAGMFCKTLGCSFLCKNGLKG